MTEDSRLNDRMALYAAAEGGHREIVRVLLKAGADALLQSKREPRTPL